MEDFKTFEQFIEECAMGECLYRKTEENSLYCQRYFGVPSEWTQAKLIKPRLNQIISHHMINFLASGHAIAEYIFSRKLYLKLLINTYFGKYFLQLRYNLMRIKSKYRYLFMRKNSAEKWPRYHDYSQKAEQWYRIKWALKTHNNSLLKKDLTLSAMNDEILFGFYLTETYQEEAFRWSSKISAIKLLVASYHKQINIKLLNLRPMNTIEGKVIFFLNNKQITEFELDKINIEINLTIPEGAIEKNENWLILFTSPWDIIKHDTRSLGLPIHSIKLL